MVCSHIRMFYISQGRSKILRFDQLFKATEIKQLCYFSTQSPFISTHTDTDILTALIDGAIYPSQHFSFGPALVSQSGNFWTHSRMYLLYYVTLFQTCYVMVFRIFSWNLVASLTMVDKPKAVGVFKQIMFHFLYCCTVHFED